MRGIGCDWDPSLLCPRKSIDESLNSIELGFYFVFLFAFAIYEIQFGIAESEI